MSGKGKRLCSLLAALVLLLTAVFSVLPVPVQAASNSLTVKAGYFGLPYATKAEYSVGEVEALGVHSALYTMNTNGGFLGYANAEGVYLKDILSSAGVTVGSINYVNFKAEDGHNASKNYYYGTLFGTRYAFPDLSKYYGQAEGVTDEDAVWESAVQVKTMLAVRDNYARVDDFSEYEPGDMSSSHRFRLMVGQEYPGQVVAADSIYKVNTVIVTYVGSPEIDAESEVNISIDEDHTLVYSVSSADSDITQMIHDGLKFESSDESVVSVDENGKLTAKRAGEVEITIYYESNDIDADDISTTVRVKVGESDGNGGNGTGDGLGDGTGDGSGSGESGSGDGDGSNDDAPSGSGNVGSGDSPEENEPDTPVDGDQVQSGSNDDQPVQKPDTDTEKAPEEPQKPSSDSKENSSGQITQVTPEEPEEEAEDVYISVEPQKTVNDYTLRVRRVRSASENAAQAPEISQGGSSGGAEGGSEALGLRLDNAMLLIAAILAVVLFLSGGAGMYVKFRKEI